MYPGLSASTNAAVPSAEAKPPANTQANKTLTRSQEIFQQFTGVNPKALTIGSDETLSHKFFLFMAMRKELQWAAHKMTPSKWSTDTATYNTRLAAICQENSHQYHVKLFHALSNKLTEVEGQVLDQLYIKNYICQCLQAMMKKGYVLMSFF